jgi:hypothetical protein
MFFDTMTGSSVGITSGSAAGSSAFLQEKMENKTITSTTRDFFIAMSLRIFTL